MIPGKAKERSVGVYLAALYFVLTGFLESIQKFREWDSPLPLSPFSERSLWHLVAHTLIYLAVAYLVWKLAWLGRVGALVYGYLTLATYLGALLLYLGGTAMNFTSLFTVIAIYHLAALPPLLFFLQPNRSKKLFQVSLLEILLPHD